jgi:hypothetical protein
MADQQYLDLLNNAIGGNPGQGRSPEESAMLWSAFGSSLQGGTPFFEAVRGMGAQRQTDALNKIKLLQMRQQMLQQQEVGNILKGTGEAPAQSPVQAALAAGAAAGQAGPTLAAQQMLSAPPAPAVPPSRMQADRYRKAAAALAATSPESADKYLAMADRLDPRVEYSQPVIERGPDGKPILVQYGKSGERMIVQGAQPKREFQTLNLGGVTKMVDTSELSGPQDYAHTMTPGEVASNRIAQANLGVAQQRLNLDQNAYDIKEGPDGFVYVPKVPGQGRAALPVMTPGGTPLQGSGGNLTEDMRKSAGFTLRMGEASKVLQQPVLGPDKNPVVNPATGRPFTLEEYAGRPAFMEAALGTTPFLGGTLERSAARKAGPERQMYRQAQQNWVSANLRAESGAVLGDKEVADEIRKYFPEYGDPVDVIAQKAAARRQAEAAMTARAGGALKGVSAAFGGQAGATPAAPAASRPAATAVPGAVLQWDPARRTFVQ